jgi:flagellar biosynthesis chaperone FliJ
MQIGLKDIDQEIASQLAARLEVAPGSYLLDNIAWRGMLPFTFTWSAASGPRWIQKRPPTPIEAQAYTSYLNRRRRQRERSLFLAMGIGSLLLFALTTYIIYGFAVSVFFLQLIWWLLLFCILGCGIGFLRDRPVPLTEKVPPKELEAALPLLHLSETERAYGDILLLLAQTSPAEPEQERELRATLAHLGRLLESRRQLENIRQNLAKLEQQENLLKLSEEYAQLVSLRDAATDPAARATFEHSIQLCLERIEGLRTLERNLERLSAQQKAIEQTILAARNALVRLHSVPHYEPQLQNASNELYDTIEQVRQRAQATEQAVIELLNMH